MSINESIVELEDLTMGGEGLSPKLKLTEV